MWFFISSNICHWRVLRTLPCVAWMCKSFVADYTPVARGAKHSPPGLELGCPKRWIKGGVPGFLWNSYVLFILRHKHNRTRDDHSGLQLNTCRWFQICYQILIRLTFDIDLDALLVIIWCHLFVQILNYLWTTSGKPSTWLPLGELANKVHHAVRQNCPWTWRKTFVWCEITIY